MAEYGLGRLPSVDTRDQAFLLTPPTPPPTRTYRYWYDNGWWGDQGPHPHCVGYAWAHFIEDSPRTHPLPGSHVDPVELYNTAQQLDEWAGTDYEGTSVRAGAKALQQNGFITEYRWAFDVETIAQNVLTVGPVVMGTEWYASMFTPDEHGIVILAGRVVGGHAWLINGYSRKNRLFRAKNSWGRSFGVRGHFYIREADLARLMSSDGEAAMALETP